MEHFYKTNVEMKRYVFSMHAQRREDEVDGHVIRNGRTLMLNKYVIWSKIKSMPVHSRRCSAFIYVVLYYFLHLFHTHTRKPILSHIIYIYIYICTGVAIQKVIQNVECKCLLQMR